MRDGGYDEMEDRGGIDEVEDEDRDVVVGGEEDIGGRLRGRLAISTVTEALEIFCFLPCFSGVFEVPSSKIS